MPRRNHFHSRCTGNGTEESFSEGFSHFAGLADRPRQFRRNYDRLELVLATLTFGTGVLAKYLKSPRLICLINVIRIYCILDALIAPFATAIVIRCVPDVSPSIRLACLQTRHRWRCNIRARVKDVCGTQISEDRTSLGRSRPNLQRIYEILPKRLQRKRREALSGLPFTRLRSFPDALHGLLLIVTKHSSAQNHNPGRTIPVAMTSARPRTLRSIFRPQTITSTSARYKVQW